MWCGTGGGILDRVNDLCAELEGLFGDDDVAVLLRNFLLRRRYQPLQAREEERR